MSAFLELLPWALLIVAVLALAAMAVASLFCRCPKCGQFHEPHCES